MIPAAFLLLVLVLLLTTRPNNIDHIRHRTIGTIGNEDDDEQ